MPSAATKSPAKRRADLRGCVCDFDGYPYKIFWAGLTRHGERAALISPLPHARNCDKRWVQFAHLENIRDSEGVR